MLKDLNEALERPANKARSEEDFENAADRLLRSQFLYRDDWGDKGVYDLILANRGYFASLFEALGRELVVSPHEALIGLLPSRPTARGGLKLDETSLLLLLRFAYDEAMARYEVGDQGEVATTTMDVLDTFETVTGRPRIERARARQIFEAFERRKLIKIGDAHPDELGWDLVIRPALRFVTGQAYLTRLEEFAASDEARAALRLPADEEEPAIEDAIEEENVS